MLPLRVGKVPVGCGVELVRKLHDGEVSVRLGRHCVHLLPGRVVSVTSRLDDVLLVWAGAVPGLAGADRMHELRGGQVPGWQREERLREVCSGIVPTSRGLNRMLAVRCGDLPVDLGLVPGFHVRLVLRGQVLFRRVQCLLVL
jgi:hypothetical protein